MAGQNPGDTEYGMFWHFGANNPGDCEYGIFWFIGAGAPPGLLNIYSKISGLWKQNLKVHVKHSGTWKQCKVYVKVVDSWVLVFE